MRNIPDDITLPQDANPGPGLKLNFKTITLPQRANVIAPELGYVLRTVPFDDPLLGRLACDRQLVRPVRYVDGWALHDDIRVAWFQLEKGLSLTARLLLTSANTAESRSVMSVEHWPNPSIYGYRRVHSTPGEAVAAIRDSRLAFLVLAARLSMAIAVWTPENRSLPDVPAWVRCLRQRDIPEAWITALQTSSISHFRYGLRAGVVVHPEDCPWKQHLSCYVRAKVPVFVVWPSQSVMVNHMKHPSWYPEVAPFCPSETDMLLAKSVPPREEVPDVYMVFFNGIGRPYPSSRQSQVRLRTPLSGPSQLPCESISAFLERMEAVAHRAILQETPAQRETRLARVAAANAASSAGWPPLASCRVYAWRKMYEVVPDVPGHWKQLDYRQPVSASAVRTLWLWYPSVGRRYNAVYDEWDLWIPWRVPVPRQISSDTRARRLPEDSRRDLTSFLLDDLDLIYPRDDLPGHRYQVTLPEGWTYLRQWYGLVVPSSFTPSMVDAGEDDEDTVFRSLALPTRGNLPSDPRVTAAYAGWISHLLSRPPDPLAGNWDFWDLKSECREFLFTEEVTTKIQVTPRLNVNGAQLYVVRYVDDPTPGPWSLAVDIISLLYLIRKFPRVCTTVAAVRECLRCGIPYHTVLSISTALLPPCPDAVDTDVPVVYRFAESARRDEVYRNELDFRVYRVRALQVLSGGTQLRAALGEGLIVWRLVNELIAPNEGLRNLAKDLPVAAPVLGKDPRSYVEVFEAQNGTSFLDNCLTEGEADVLCGVCRVYGREQSYNLGSLFPG